MCNYFYMQTMFAEHVLHVFRYTVFTLLIAWIIMRLIKLKVLTALKNSPQEINKSNIQ